MSPDSENRTSGLMDTNNNNYHSTEIHQLITSDKSIDNLGNLKDFHIEHERIYRSQLSPLNSVKDSTSSSSASKELPKLITIPRPMRVYSQLIDSRSNTSSRSSQRKTFKRALFTVNLETLPNHCLCHSRSVSSFQQQQNTYDHLTSGTFSSCQNEEDLPDTDIQCHITKSSDIYNWKKQRKRRNTRFIGACDNDIKNRPYNNLHHCRFCSMTFKHLSNLKSHTVLVHDHESIDDTSAQTDHITCGNNSLTGLKDTAVSDSSLNICCNGNNTRKDDLCRKENGSDVLENISRLHACDICERVFKYKVNLTTHQDIVHLVKLTTL